MHKLLLVIFQSKFALAKSCLKIYPYSKLKINCTSKKTFLKSKTFISTDKNTSQKTKNTFLGNKHVHQRIRINP